jgi:hypothetical protein
VDQKVIDKLNTLEFDVFVYKDNGDEDMIILLTMIMFHKLGLVEEFNISELTLFRFCKSVCLRYRSVPFHNFYHAWNVCQTLFFFLVSGGGNCLGPIEKISLMIAALCHDCDHPGLNNSFQAKASTRVSLLHKKSTLENHHLLQCMHILEQPESNILENIKHNKSLVSLYIKHLILATDLALHGAIHMNLINRKKTLSKFYLKQSSTEPVHEDDKILLMCSFLKCADLSNEIRPTSISHKWANLVLQEFFMQSDKERELDLPVTTFMDRQKVIISKEQINFIEKLCLPLYEPMCDICPFMNVCVKNLNTNRMEWNIRLRNWCSEKDANASKALTNQSIWEPEKVKKKWEKSIMSLLSTRSSGSEPKKKNQK